MALSPFPRGGDSRDIGNRWLTPKGRKLESHTKTLMERVPSESVKPLPWRGLRGLGIRLKPSLTVREGWVS